MSNSSIQRRAQSAEARVTGIVDQALPTIRKKMAGVEVGDYRYVVLESKRLRAGGYDHLLDPVGRRLNDELQRDGYEVAMSARVKLVLPRLDKIVLEAKVTSRPDLAHPTVSPDAPARNPQPIDEMIGSESGGVFGQ